MSRDERIDLTKWAEKDRPVRKLMNAGKCCLKNSTEYDMKENSFEFSRYKRI